jgi:hypothetical protein
MFQKSYIEGGNEAEALAFEREEAADNIRSRQCIEGISAFLEKSLKPDAMIVLAEKRPSALGFRRPAEDDLRLGLVQPLNTGLKKIAH